MPTCRAKGGLSSSSAVGDLKSRRDPSDAAPATVCPLALIVYPYQIIDIMTGPMYLLFPWSAAHLLAGLAVDERWLAMGGYTTVCRSLVTWWEAQSSPHNAYQAVLAREAVLDQTERHQWKKR